MVVEGLDAFALPEHMEVLFNYIYNCHDILPFVLFATEELVLGGHCYSAALADETNEGHLAFDPSKITCTPVIVSWWIAMLGAGYELLGRFAFQGRQTMPGGAAFRFRRFGYETESDPTNRSSSPPHHCARARGVE